jgi:hypothetical protein
MLRLKNNETADKGQIHHPGNWFKRKNASGLFTLTL